MNKYAKTFENKRRINPFFWNSDYCLLKGLANFIKSAAQENLNKNSVILDYGCGAKPYKIFFPKDCKYIGVDTVESQYADIFLVPGNNIPMHDKSVDCILSTQVVYLIPENEQYLNECKRLIKDDGFLLLTTHGTWTHHPASGGDYYRYTQDGIKHILNKAGFLINEITPVVGTLGTGLHLRQLVFNSWFRRIPLGWLFSNLINIVYNFRIIISDIISPIGTRLSSPVIFCIKAKPILNGK